MALAPGGDRVALCARGRVGVHAWGTDRIWWSGPDPAEPRVPRDSDQTDHLAAFSPDGRALAVLATSMVDDGRVPFEDDEGSLAVVSVIDLVTGRRRRLWSGVGGWSAESAVGWSPGGDLVAATYLVPPEPADEDYVASVSAASTTSS